MDQRSAHVELEPSPFADQDAPAVVAGAENRRTATGGRAGCVHRDLAPVPRRSVENGSDRAVVGGGGGGAGAPAASTAPSASARPSRDCSTSTPIRNGAPMRPAISPAARPTGPVPVMSTAS